METRSFSCEQFWALITSLDNQQNAEELEKHLTDVFDWIALLQDPDFDYDSIDGALSQIHSKKTALLEIANGLLQACRMLDCNELNEALKKLRTKKQHLNELDRQVLCGLADSLLIELQDKKSDNETQEATKIIELLHKIENYLTPSLTDASEELSTENQQTFVSSSSLFARLIEMKKDFPPDIFAESVPGMLNTFESWYALLNAEDYEHSLMQAIIGSENCLYSFLNIFYQLNAAIKEKNAQQINSIVEALESLIITKDVSAIIVSFLLKAKQQTSLSETFAEEKIFIEALNRLESLLVPNLSCDENDVSFTQVGLIHEDSESYIDVEEEEGDNAANDQAEYILDIIQSLRDFEQCKKLLQYSPSRKEAIEILNQAPIKDKNILLQRLTVLDQLLEAINSKDANALIKVHDMVCEVDNKLTIQLCLEYFPKQIFLSDDKQFIEALKELHQTLNDKYHACQMQNAEQETYEDQTGYFSFMMQLLKTPSQKTSPVSSKRKLPLDSPYIVKVRKKIKLDADFDAYAKWMELKESNSCEDNVAKIINFLEDAEKFKKLMKDDRFIDQFSDIISVLNSYEVGPQYKQGLVIACRLLKALNENDENKLEMIAGQYSIPDFIISACIHCLKESIAAEKLLSAKEPWLAAMNNLKKNLSERRKKNNNSSSLLPEFSILNQSRQGDAQQQARREEKGKEKEKEDKYGPS
jgi:hypothetical protein